MDVSNNSALSFSAVFNAVTIIAGTLASLPLILYRRIGEHEKERLQTHPLYTLLHDQPNPEMSSFTWREISQSHLLLQGNAYSFIQRDGMGRAIALWPQNPGMTAVKRDEAKRIFYEIDEGDGHKRRIEAIDMLHIPGLGYDGRIGYAVLTLAREAMGLGLGMEKFQALFYGAGTNIGAVLSHPNRLGQEALNHLRESLAQKYAGLQQSHKVLILEEGMTYERMGMPLEDAQFLESRTFSILEMCRWFNLPAHKLKETTRMTFNNVEQEQINFIVDCMRLWFVRWEQAINSKLLLPEERKDLFVEFLIDALMRGDTVARNQALALQRINGVINADQWCAIENMNPIGGKAGKMYWMPLNYQDANSEEAGKPQPKPAFGQPADGDGDKKKEKKQLLDYLLEQK